jgi:hypothetical protein
MCMQCMMGAMTAGASASGLRAWLGRRSFTWLTPKRLRFVTVVLLLAALTASSLLLGGSSTPSHA